MVVELLEGLTYAHERGVIHRDIKPSNVRVASDGRVKIMDFGIARLQSADATGTGAIVGTPNYMAPEQVTNGPITPATDLFSVGCLMYELLSYHKPFDGDTVHGVLYQVLTTDPKPLRTMAPSIPAALERVVSKALNKVPEDRYQSARQMQQVLLGIRAALSGATDATQRLNPRWTPIPAPVMRLVTLRWRVMGLSVLGALGLLVLYVSRGRVQPAQPPPAVMATPPEVPPIVVTPPARAPSDPERVRGGAAACGCERHARRAARLRAEGTGPCPPRRGNQEQRAVGVLAETMLQSAEQGLRGGDHARASGAYLSAVLQYRNARTEVENCGRKRSWRSRAPHPSSKASRPHSTRRPGRRRHSRARNRSTRRWITPWRHPRRKTRNGRASPPASHPPARSRTIRQPRSVFCSSTWRAPWRASG